MAAVNQTGLQNSDSDISCLGSYKDVHHLVKRSSVLPSKRKRQRKNVAPKRKIIKIVDEFSEGVDDTSVPLSLTTCQMEEEQNTCDSVPYNIDNNPRIYELTVGSIVDNKNANNSNMAVEDITKNVTIPIFVKKSKISALKQNQDVNESPLVHKTTESVVHSDQTVGSHTVLSNDNLLSECNISGRSRKNAKQKLVRNLPNTFSSTKKITTKSFKTKGVNYKNKPPVPVTIRPKISGKPKISTATCMFFDDQTLNKQIASPIKHVNAELHNKHSNQQTPLTSGESVNNTECKLPENESVRKDSTSTGSSVNRSSLSPVAINQFPSSTVGHSEVISPLSKPHYRSRLRSKSGTTYIVRKDSISANISDFFKSPFNRRSSPGRERQIILQLSDNKNVNFIRTLIDPQFGSAKMGFDEKQESSRVDELSSHTRSPQDNISKDMKSLLQKSTHAQNEVHISETPIRLYSKGGLEDVKLEMNLLKPNTWNVPDDKNVKDIIKQSCIAIPAITKTPNQRFLANLQARIMAERLTSPRLSNSFNQTMKCLSSQDTVQTFSLLFKDNEKSGDSKLENRQKYNVDKTKINDNEEKWKLKNTNLSLIKENNDITRDNDTPSAKMKQETDFEGRKGCLQYPTIKHEKVDCNNIEKTHNVPIECNNAIDFNEGYLSSSNTKSERLAEDGFGKGQQTDYNEKGQFSDFNEKKQHTDYNEKREQIDYNEKRQHTIYNEKVHGRCYDEKIYYTDCGEKNQHTDCYEKRQHTDYYEKRQHTDYYEKKQHTDYYEKKQHTDCYDKRQHTDYFEKRQNADYYEEGKHTDYDNENFTAIKMAARNRDTVKQERTNSVHRRQNNVTEIDEEQESIVVENNKTKPRDVFKNFDKKIINNINIKIHSEESTQMKENNRLSTLNIKQEKSENDYAYGRSDEKTISTNEKSHTDITVDELQSGYQRTDNLNIQNTKMAPIPVYAVRCGENVVLFPASKALAEVKVANKKVVVCPTPIRTPANMSPSRGVKRKLSNKYSPCKSKKKRRTEFTEKCHLRSSKENKTEEVDPVNDLITMDFKNIVNKRSRNNVKHMCAVIVQITRLDDKKFSFSKDIRVLTFTNGSNPSLIRWYDDGICVAMVTFSSKGDVQHLRVDKITSGFYCLTLKNDNGLRKNKTFEALLTSTLPNEDLFLAETDFLAIGEIKSIMDPTIFNLNVRQSTTLKEALSDVLPSNLMNVYNPTISDRSYRPKVDDKTWYSAENFEIFTKMYGCKRGFHPHGCRFPGEEAG